jgi:uncharacterized protein
MDLNSAPHNPKLIEWLKMMRDERGAAFVRALSEGTKRMRDEMKSESLPVPIYKVSESQTEVILFNNALKRESHLGDKRLKLVKTVGSYVEGDRFWGREREISLFVEDLDAGTNILLIGQRRMGKTSLTHQVSRQIQDRYLCLHVDLEQSVSAADAIVELSAATRQDAELWDKTKKIFGNILQSIDKVDSLQVAGLKIALRGGLTGKDWQDKGDQLLEALANADRPVVIFFDEVPILVSRLLKGEDFVITPERRRQVDEFMSWLRANSQKYQGKVRMVLTGSIGLEPILRQAGLSATINHLTPFELGYWSAETARGCLAALAQNYEVIFESGVIDRIFENLGVLVPYYVQMFFDSIDRYCVLNDIKTVSVDVIDEVYHSKMLGVRGQSNLSHLEERLRMMLDLSFYPLALDLLTETAVVGFLTPAAINILGKEASVNLNNYSSINEVCREILMVLEHNGYLNKSKVGYVFVSKFIRDLWVSRYQYNYVPSAER